MVEALRQTAVLSAEFAVYITAIWIVCLLFLLSNLRYYILSIGASTLGAMLALIQLIQGLCSWLTGIPTVPAILLILSLITSIFLWISFARSAAKEERDLRSKKMVF